MGETPRMVVTEPGRGRSNPGCLLPRPQLLLQGCRRSERTDACSTHTHNQTTPEWLTQGEIQTHINYKFEKFHLSSN